MNLFTKIFLLVIFLPILAYGEEKNSHKQYTATLGVESLSDELRDLLSKEMIALQNGMKSIIPAYVSGNWSEIENTARQMKNSYILSQKLSKAQAKELHSSLPHAFVKKDQRFHYLAGMLEHAAKMEKPELINFYFSEMNESCVSCHQSYAKHKFPNFAVKEKEQHGH